MGLFGSSTKVIVGSSAFNLAGDVLKRPNYLKTTVVAAVLSEDQAFTPQFMNSYLTGPGVKLKRFDKWASKPGGYNSFVGNTASALLLGSGVNAALLTAYMAGGYRQVRVSRTYVGPREVSYWALQYILANVPQFADSGWKVETKVRSVFIEDGEGLREEFEQWPPNTYSIVIPGQEKIDIVVSQDPTGLYLYTEYIESPLEERDPISIGEWEEYSLDPGTLPSTAGWALIEDVPLLYGGWIRTYTKRGDDLPPSGDRGVRYTQEYMQQFKDVRRLEREVPGETPADPPVIEVYFETWYTYRYGYSTVTESIWSGRKLDIYRFGSGDTTLDSLISNREQARAGKFLPIIPLRLNNIFVDKEAYPAAFAQTKPAFKKATGGKIEKVLRSLADNPDLKQIDNAYVVFGVALNVHDNDSKEYLFELFKALSQDSGFIGVPRVDEVINQIEEQNIRMKAWLDWMNGGEDGPRPVQPPFPTYTPLPEVGFRVTSTGTTDWGYDVRISWSGARVIAGVGVLVPGTKKGDFSVINDGQDTYNIYVMPDGDSTQAVLQPMTVPRILVVKQVTANSWEAVRIWDLKHTNTIYRERAVVTTAMDAIAKTEESSFIVPVNMDSLNAAGLIRSAQIAMSCSHLVVNYYDEQKIPWYASGFFQIIVIVVVIIVAIYTGYVSGESIGALGANAAVGTALGFAGTAAIVAGAMANAFAGMIIASLIQKGATTLFGDKIGQIVGFIAAAYTMNALASGETLALSMESVMAKLRDPAVWLKMTDAVNGQLQAEVRDVAAQQQDFLADYQSKMNEITGLKQQFGNTGVDLLTITQATKLVLESPEQFLGRTLLTGDEIASATIGLIENFPVAELRLPLL